MAWTKEQQMAMSTWGCNLLVAAAAGAGKTAVLVERIIKRLMDEKDPVDIDRLLVVTFTNAAACEMRERIGDAISKALEKSPGSSRLQSQSALIAGAPITTIHSFCLEVIRSNFHRIDLDPGFRVADATECILLKNEVLEEMFDDLYESDDNCDFLKLVECYGGGRSDAGLQDMVLRLYEFSQSTPYPGDWLYDAAGMFNTDSTFDFGKSIWAEILLQDMKIELHGMYNSMSAVLNSIECLADFEPYYTHIKNELDEIKKLIDACSSPWDYVADAFSRFEFKSLPRCRKGADEDTKKAVTRSRDDVKSGIKGIKEGLLSYGSEKIGEQMRALYPSMKALSDLTVEFGKRFKDKKREKGLIDFNDIEHYAIDILCERRKDGIFPSPAALRYRERFLEVLVDEYQDSNMVQELILSMVSRKDTSSPNLFMVGDVKQSIYRFRQAKPELFLEKYNTYSDSGMNRRILLYKNFRSRTEVLDAANYVFRCIMSKNIGEMEYGDGEKLNPGAVYPQLTGSGKITGGPVEVHITETLKNEADDTDGNRDEDEEPEEQEDLSTIQLEARMVAKRINKLVHEQSFMVTYTDIDEKDENRKIKYRPVEYRDIVILMRSVSVSAPVFMEELSKLSVPVYSDTGSGYFEAVEVRTILSLLETVDNPMQDIPLIAVLRSPIATFNEQELIDIRLCCIKSTFYEALKAKAEECGDGLSAKCSAFLDTLDSWRKKSRVMPICDFIWYLYNNTGYYAYAGAMPGGSQRQANLRILFERAKQYEDTSYKGLFNFINFINRLKANSGDLGEAKALGENQNVVRIMSIHKSKGLEFPVVFVSGLGKKFNLRDLESPVLFHHNLGFGPDYIDSGRRIRYTTVVKQALKKKMKLENYSEEMRILYVAMTRAREKLILTGTAGSIEKSISRWSAGLGAPGKKVPEYQILRGSNFLDWICPALLKHEGNRDFRELGEVSLNPEALCDDNSTWCIKVWNRNDILGDSAVMVYDAAAGYEGMEEGRYSGEIKRRLNYQYLYIRSTRVHAKLTVTELKKMLGTPLDDEYAEHIFAGEAKRRPVFLEGKSGLSAAEKGTVMHLVMQHTALNKAQTVENIKLLLDYMTMEEFLTSSQKSSVDIRKIVRFFESPLGIRLLRADAAKREVPFYMEVDSREIYHDMDGSDYGGSVILQGVIDCYFEEADGLVLIDYKTDYIPDNNVTIIKDRYRVQMDYYACALERLTGKHVKEKYIYLFYNGEILEF